MRTHTDSHNDAKAKIFPVINTFSFVQRQFKQKKKYKYWGKICICIAVCKHHFSWINTFLNDLISLCVYVYEVNRNCILLRKKPFVENHIISYSQSRSKIKTKMGTVCNLLCLVSLSIFVSTIFMIPEVYFTTFILIWFYILLKLHFRPTYLPSKDLNAKAHQMIK